jgi:hypothetical protein
MKRLSELLNLMIVIEDGKKYCPLLARREGDRPESYISSLLKTQKGQGLEESIKTQYLLNLEDAKVFGIPCSGNENCEGCNTFQDFQERLEIIEMKPVKDGNENTIYIKS